MTSAGPVPPRGSGPAFFRRRVLIVGGVLLLTFAGSVVAAMWLVQGFATFPRPPESAWNPAARVRHAGEQLWLEVEGGRVEAWFLPPRAPAAAAGPAPLLIYAHGNGELIDMRAGDFSVLREAGMAVLQVEYPGYGRSAGSPSERSLTAALVAAYDWAAHDARVDPRRIAGYGRSLGGGAIAQLASRRPLAALVLESTFESLSAVVMGYGVPRPFLINHFETGTVLRDYPGPVLLLHGTRDRTFDSRHARTLAGLARRATLHLDECGHNDCPPQWEMVLGFLTQNGVCRGPGPEVADEVVTSC